MVGGGRCFRDSFRFYLFGSAEGSRGVEAVSFMVVRIWFEIAVSGFFFRAGGESF